MALSHIVMHLALCNSAARLGPQAELPVHLVVTDKINRNIVDKTDRVVRYNGNNSSIEFDIPWGLYRADLSMKAGHATCSVVQYFAVLIDHDRSINVQLQDRPDSMHVPALIQGDAPMSYSYVEPTVTVFGNDTKCNGPVGNPVGADIDQQNDSDGFYASVYPNPALERSKPFVVAVRLKDSQGGYHYLRVPGNFLTMTVQWPSSGQMNVTEDVIDYVQDKPEDTLLCPKMHETMTQ